VYDVRIVIIYSNVKSTKKVQTINKFNFMKIFSIIKNQESENSDTYNLYLHNNNLAKRNGFLRLIL